MLGERRRVLRQARKFVRFFRKDRKSRRLKIMNDNEMIDGERRKLKRSLFLLLFDLIIFLTSAFSTVVSLEFTL